MLAPPTEQVSPQPSGFDSESPKKLKRLQDETAEHISPKEKPDHPLTKPVPDNPTQDQDTEEPSASDNPALDDKRVSEDAVPVAKEHHKRGEDAVAAAKARYLARKKAKV